MSQLVAVLPSCKAVSLVIVLDEMEADSLAKFSEIVPRITFLNWSYVLQQGRERFAPPPEHVTNKAMVFQLGSFPFTHPSCR